jgi:hypothetical protein
VKYNKLIKYIPLFISFIILAIFTYKIVNVERIYDNYYVLLFYKYRYYTIHNITINTIFGRIYIKKFTPTEKIYSFRSELSNPPYY